MAEWISYESSDEPPAEVSVDVDFDQDATFKQAHPYAAIVTISGFSASADGQPDDSTAEALYDFERQAEAALSGSGGALVCTVSEDGKFILYGYVADPSNVDALRTIVAASLAVDARSERDDAWDNYGRYVLRGEELEAARDAEQIGELEESGSLLDEPFDVSFYLEFDDNVSLRRAIPALRSAGYTVPEFILGNGDDGVCVTRELLLTPENLRSERASLQRLVAPFNGRYTGWSLDEDELEQSLAP
jgi:Regulator of ribonuclease activity B/Family of unknown function (DUF695)